MSKLMLKLFLTCMVIFFTKAAFCTPQNITSPATADSYFQQQDWPKAAVAYQEIADLQPQNYLAWYRLANALIELNTPSPALQALKNAANSPSLPKSVIFYQQARAYKLLNEQKTMFENLQQAADSGYAVIANLQENLFWEDEKDNEQFISITTLVDKNARPCVYDDKYAQFDFWLGHWDVYGNLQKTGPSFGHNFIEKSQNGCLLTEHWTGAGGSTGTSMNYYDGTIDRWVQHWVSASGTTINYSGNIQNGSMVLNGKIFYINTVQDPIRDFRGTWTLLSDGIVRQFFEESIDAGKTWYTWFEGFYFAAKTS